MSKNRERNNLKAAQLLLKMQERLNRLGALTGQNQADVFALNDEMRAVREKLEMDSKNADRAWALNASRAAVNEKFRYEADEWAKAVNKNLKTLFDSSQKSFDNVGADVRNLVSADKQTNVRIDELNKRLMEVEGVIASIRNLLQALNNFGMAPTPAPSFTGCDNRNPAPTVINSGLSSGQ